MENLDLNADARLFLDRLKRRDAVKGPLLIIGALLLALGAMAFFYAYTENAYLSEINLKRTDLFFVFESNLALPVLALGVILITIVFIINHRSSKEAKKILIKHSRTVDTA